MRYHHSPLRYPGGKAALGPYLGKIVEANGITGGLYVEPFAGGAGCAMYLLFSEYVGEVILNDKDPNVYACWKAILSETDSFLEKLDSTDVTLNEWRKQKAIYHRAPRKRTYSTLEIGFATFFLNRTNRSGVMDGGPIGGLDQSGPYKIDARYSKARLAQRIYRIAAYKDRISIFNKDAATLLRTLAKGRLGSIGADALVYCDPPYFKKGPDVYDYFFSIKEHRTFARFINGQKFRWMISYDDAELIHQIYSKRDRNVFFMNYCVHCARQGRELIISSTNCELPLTENFQSPSAIAL